MLALKDQPTTEAQAMDRRRVTELDADYMRLHHAMAKSLTASLRTYAGELKAGTPAHIAAKAFVQRHTHLLATAYDLAHYEGQRDYHETVSLTPKQMPLVEPDATLKNRRLAFYLPSVTKMAREGAEAQRERRLSPVTARLADEADGYNANVILATVPQGDALDDWLDGLGVRVDLQAGIAWPGMQDGYVSGGAADRANPYSLVYWLLEPLAQHCHDCPAFAANSPYNAPGSGGNELWIAPGDGTSECGAGCRCSLSYEPDTSDEALSAAYWTDQYSKWLPDGMPETFAGEGGRDVLLQTFAPRLQAQPGPLTDGQKRALDALRGALADWDAVRGAYPSAPNFFAGMAQGGEGDAPSSIPVEWDQLTKAQQRVILRVLAALDTWDFWTQEAWLNAPEGDDIGLAEDDDAGAILLSNPYPRGPHGHWGEGGEHGEGGMHGGAHQSRIGEGRGAGVHEHVAAHHHEGRSGGGGGSRHGQHEEGDEFSRAYHQVETTRAAYNSARAHYDHIVNSAPHGGFVHAQSPEFQSYIQQSREAREQVRQAYEHYSSAFRFAQSHEAARIAQEDGTGVRVYYADEQALHTVDAVFGRHMSRSDFARVSGLPSGSHLVLGGAAGLGGPSPSFTMESYGRSFFSTRFMRSGLAHGGAVTLLSPVVRNDAERTASSGREVVRGLLALRKMGVQVIHATAQRGSQAVRASRAERDWNGYYTWAKMGFKGPVPHGLGKAVRERFPELANERNLRVEQVMAQHGGAAWWKEHGRTWDATLDFREPDTARLYDAWERRLGS